MRLILVLFTLLFVTPAFAEESASEYWAKEQALQQKLNKPTLVKGKTLEVHFKTNGSLLDHAMRYLGMRNMTGFRGPWCGAFMGMIAKEAGAVIPKDYKLAAAWSKVGTRISKPEVGAVAVMRHHVGVIAGVEGGKILLVSGNHNRRVGEGLYAQRRVIAYVRI
jgi:uncharacterized protein (TIGR02594 family)